MEKEIYPEKHEGCGSEMYLIQKAMHIGLYCDKCGWIKWMPQKWQLFSMPFGKYKGKTLTEIIEVDKKYLEWFAENGESKGIVRKCKEALNAAVT